MRILAPGMLVVGGRRRDRIAVGGSFAGSLTKLPTAARIAGVPAWTNKDNCLLDDTNAAQVTLAVGETSGDLFVDNYDFSALPDPCEIVGIELLINRKATTGGIRDNSLQLLDIAGDPAGDNKGNVIDVWPNGLNPFRPATVWWFGNYVGAGLDAGLACEREFRRETEGEISRGHRRQYRECAVIGRNDGALHNLGETI